jgi:hypothetical protein
MSFTLLRGQDSDLLRKLMGLPGKPFPTLPREKIAELTNYIKFLQKLSKEQINGIINLCMILEKNLEEKR